jgi:hypothetical protein
VKDAYLPRAVTHFLFVPQNLHKAVVCVIAISFYIYHFIPFYFVSGADHSFSKKSVMKVLGATS